MSEPEAETEKKKGCGCFVPVFLFICSIILVLIYGLYFLRWFANPMVEETIESGDTGWLVIGDAQRESNKPTHRPEGGNPGAHMMAVDDAVGGVWYWAAPEEFLQTLTSAWATQGTLDAKLSFDLKQSIQGNPNPFDSSDIILSNGKTEVYFMHARQPGSDWTSFRVPLDPSKWRHSETDEAVSEEEMNAVLSQLNKLWIRGEFHTGKDNGGIDNVSIR